MNFYAADVRGSKDRKGIIDTNSHQEVTNCKETHYLYHVRAMKSYRNSFICELHSKASAIAIIKIGQECSY